MTDAMALVSLLARAERQELVSGVEKAVFGGNSDDLVTGYHATSEMGDVGDSS